MNTILTRLLTILPPICGLTEVASAQLLLGLDTTRTVWTVDRATAAKAQLGVLSPAAGTTTGIAVHVPTNTIYVASSSTDSLYTFNPNTGVTTLVGPFGASALVMQSLESIGDQLYGTSSHDGGLYTIDRTTGAASLVGVLGVVGTPNLLYDSRLDELYATSTGNDCLFRVDRTTGVATLIGNLQGVPNPQGLAFDRDTGASWLVDNATDLLYTIDTATGRAHAIGSTGAGNLVGLAYVPGGTGAIQTLDHACGAATITVGGDPGIGGGVSVFLDEWAGTPFLGFGTVPTPWQFCGCTAGHDWAAVVGGAAAFLAIPINPGLIGAQVGMQGLDYGGPGSCGNPAFGLTDTLLLTIG